MPVLTELQPPRTPVVATLHDDALMPTISGTAMRVVVPSEATAGAYGVWLNRMEPGSGPPRHVHHREDEIFHVLEGKLLIWCDGDTYEALPGQIAALPRGIPHTFRVISDSPARMLTTVVPGGFERFFAAVAGLVVPRDMGELVRISDGYGVAYVGPPLEG